MVIGARGENDSRLQRILNRIFRCSHRRQTRPITPRGGGQAYAVCLDCGTRLAYDLNAMGGGASFSGSRLERQTSEAGKEKVLDIPAHGFILGSHGRWETIWNDSLRFHREFGTTAVLWLGVMSLAVGLLYLRNRPAGPKNLTTQNQARSSVSADSMKSSPNIPVQQRGTEVVRAPQATTLATPTVATEPTATPEKKTIEADSTSASAAPRSDQVLRLQGKRSVIMLGREAGAALELSQHPERVSKLIRSGSLFTVPRGTAIKLLQGNRMGNQLVVKVRIMEGSMVGQAGWAQTWQISP